MADQKRGACWLPQSVFKPLGVSLDKVDIENIENFKKGIDQVISVAQHHLVNAFKYTTLIPKKEKGIQIDSVYGLSHTTLVSF